MIIYPSKYKGHFTIAIDISYLIIPAIIFNLIKCIALQILKMTKRNNSPMEWKNVAKKCRSIFVDLLLKAGWENEIHNDSDNIFSEF